MPLIKPRTRGKQVLRHIARLDREILEALYAYAEFLGESPDYVLNEIVDITLSKDKDFAKWRAEHPQSFLPDAVLQPRGSRKNSRPHTASVAPARAHTEPDSPVN
jgi:hypothetical protein